MEDDASVERQVRAAHNQALFRQINEKLEGLAETFEFIAQTGSFACECADVSCVAQVSLTVDEYEAIRAEANSFFVLPGHVYLDVERVISKNERYVVVAKIGKGAEIAEKRDPRS